MRYGFLGDKRSIRNMLDVRSRACLNFFTVILAKAISKLFTVHGLKAMAIWPSCFAFLYI